MKKLIATMAIAGLGASLAAGAHAQTVGSNPAGSYLVNIAASAAPSINTTGDYTYTYVATLLSNSSGAPIDTFTFGGIQKFDGFATASAPFDTVNATTSNNGLTTIVYESSTTGLDAATPTATFTYDSMLPPGGTIGITPSQNAIGGGPGTGNKFLGPGANAVPEASSFALLGLGLLPLGLVARRRISKN